MFNAQFISATEGVSKAGNAYYKMECIATTVNGGAKVLSSFCTETAYAASKNLKPMQLCKVACGVTENGFLTISNIRAEA